MFFMMAAEDQNMKPYPDAKSAIAQGRITNKGKNFGPVDHHAKGLKVVKGFNAQDILNSKEKEIQIYGHSSSVGGKVVGVSGTDFGFDPKKWKTDLVNSETIANLAIPNALSNVDQIAFFNCSVGAGMTATGSDFVKEFLKKTKIKDALSAKVLGVMSYKVYVARDTGSWAWGDWGGVHEKRISDALEGVMKKLTVLKGFADKAAFEKEIDAEFLKVKNQKDTHGPGGIFTHSSSCLEAYYDIFIKNYSDFKSFKKP